MARLLLDQRQQQQAQVAAAQRPARAAVATASAPTTAATMPGVTAATVGAAFTAPAFQRMAMAAGTAFVAFGAATDAAVMVVMPTAVRGVALGCRLGATVVGAMAVRAL